MVYWVQTDCSPQEKFMIKIDLITGFWGAGTVWNAASVPNSSPWP